MAVGESFGPGDTFGIEYTIRAKGKHTKKGYLLEWELDIGGITHRGEVLAEGGRLEAQTQAKRMAIDAMADVAAKEASRTVWGVGSYVLADDADECDRILGLSDVRK